MQQARFQSVSAALTRPSSSCQSNCGIVTVRNFHCIEPSQLFLVTIMQSIFVGILMCLALTFNSEKGTFHLKSVDLICKCGCPVRVYINMCFRGFLQHIEEKMPLFMVVFHPELSSFSVLVALVLLLEAAR